jgi:hypothetical protein
LGRPILQRPVPRYFVMLDRLSGSQQPGIERWAVLIVFDDFFAFFENAFNGFTGFCLRPLSKNLKNLLKPNEKSFAARSIPVDRVTEAACGLGARSRRLREPRRSSGQLLAAAIGHQKGGNAGRRRGKHEIEGRREGKSGGSDERGGDRWRGATAWWAMSIISCASSCQIRQLMMIFTSA